MYCLNCHQNSHSDQSCSHCGIFLPTLLRDLLPPGHPLQGGKYQVQSALGRGGFGVTYLARHQVLDKRVAIKEYFPQAHSQRHPGAQGSFSLQGFNTGNDNSFGRGLQRFLREGKLLGQLNHPGIVRVEDFFEENGTAYLVMEYLQGQTLKAWLAQQDGKLSADEVQHLGAQLVSALACAHAEGIYHLDIKPENIILQNQQLKLIDFGSARPESGHSQSTRSFTAQYAAPEIMAQHAVGPYSDIFELAMVLHELLTGSPPPEAMQRLFAPWAPTDLPEPWQALLTTALQLQPDQRPQEIAAWWANAFPSAAVQTTTPPGATSQTLKKCPYCAEQIQAEAIKCRYCGEFLNVSATVAKASEPQRHQQHSIPTTATASEPAQEGTSASASAVAKAAYPPSFSNTLGMDFVLIQPGSFMMGSPQDEQGRNDNEALHKVILTQAFYLQSTPVTQAQWQAVMGKNPSHFKGPDRPVECVSWEDCQVFVQKLNAQGLGHYRLPTEAEWEYACRAGTRTPFGIGNGVDLDSSQANFDGSRPYGKGKEGIYREETTPVKSFAPNAWGLYDMHGNVWEWCQDWHGQYPRGAVTDPSGPDISSFRVLRGGGWRNHAQRLRSAYRFRYSPGFRDFVLGFRLVRYCGEFLNVSATLAKASEPQRHQHQSTPTTASAPKLAQKGTSAPAPAVAKAAYPPKLGMEFVLIQPGSFMMGSPEDEEERSKDEVLHKVTLTRPFYLQNTPVTQNQWQAVMGQNPSRFKGPDRPVECVSWEDCQKFIQKLNSQGRGHYRLPTEAEWEYACRAGTRTLFAIGNGVDLDSSQANFDGNYSYGKGKEGIYREETTPVKSFAPNAWGLYDMHGNVWEWCQDWYGQYPSGAVTDPSGPETGSSRVLRGGSWYYDAQRLRSAFRDGSAPDFRDNDLGLRLVRRP